MLSLSAQFSITFAVAFLMALLVTFFVRKVALAFRAIDVPNLERKIHSKAVPLWGGMAVYASVIVTLLLAQSLGWLVDDRVPVTLLWGIACGGLIVVVGGMLDDRFNFMWWQQAIFPLLAIVVLLASGLEVSYITNPVGAGILTLNAWKLPMGEILGQQWYFSPFADMFLIVWVLGMMYTTKLLDGIDGLTSSVSFVASAVIFIVSLSWDKTGSTTSFLAVALAGTLLGFLVWNWHPAKIFLGEGGSVLIGLLLAVLAVMSGGKIATALLVMGIPILDVMWIIMRRVRSGAKWYVGDAQHLHFRLLRAGMSQRKIVLFLSGLSLAFGSVSFFFTTRAKLMALATLVVCMIILSAILVKKYEKNNR